MAQEELTTPGWTHLAAALLERELVISQTGDDSTAADEAVAGALSSFGACLAADDAFAAITISAELSAAEAQVLALCAAVDADRRLQRLAGTLIGDPRATSLDVSLLAQLLGPDAVDLLAEDAALRRGCLLEVEPGVAFASARITVPRAVSWALREDLSLDPALPADTRVALVPPERVGLASLVLVHGQDPVRRRQAALDTCAGLAFLLTSAPTDGAGWEVLIRQATLGGLGVVLELTGPVDPLTRHWVERATHVSFALCSQHPLDLRSVPDREHIEVSAADPDVTDAEWASVFPGSPPPARRPTASQLHMARHVAGSSGDGQEVMRRVATGTLLSHATRVVPRVTWGDLVLPDSHERQLRSVIDRYRQRHTVHTQWGLPLFPSPGVVALFSGPSGTGKTTSAEVIAHELGVDMFRVDLSALVSKYIGETEKNLEEIFAAAHTGNFLLLFDEADSLFGSRSKVEDARDRYANLEVSYLLQRLETYDGLVVLTTNFQGNIDQAFLRRIHVTVSFPVPGAAERARMWQLALAQAPQHELDLQHVAEQFDLSGGSIRNAALSAAFAAAAAGTSVGMPELLRAVVGEMSKLGRRVGDNQLGRWAADVPV